MPERQCTLSINYLPAWVLKYQTEIKSHVGISVEKKKKKKKYKNKTKQKKKKKKKKIKYKWKKLTEPPSIHGPEIKMNSTAI